MRLVFLGTPAFAVPTLERIVEAGHQVLAVVTQPDRPRGRGQHPSPPPVKEAAARMGLAVRQPERVRLPESVEFLRALGAEAMVVVGYGQIIPQTVIDLAPLGIVNVHASLLPKYRGAGPVQWAILNGETRTGVTTMRIDAGLDTGDMLLKSWTEIGPDENGIELGQRLAAMGADLLVETLAGGGHYDQAIQFLEAEMAKNPSRIDLQMALGNIAARAKNYDLAIGQFQTVLNELDKNSKARGDVYFRMGIALRQKGDLNGSIQFLFKAREALPVNSTVGVELALALSAAGRKPEAKEAYEQSIKLDPQDGVALNNLAFLIAQSGSGDLDQALTYAQRAKQALPNLTEVSDTLGWIYLKKNMSDNAMDIFQGLVNQKPENPTYRFHLGMALAQKGDKPKALRELQRALRSNPGKDEETKIKDLISKL